MKRVVIILLILIIALTTPPALAVNRVPSLDGDGDYVEIANSESLNAINSQVTMEAWIKPTAFPNTWIAMIFKGDERTANLSNRSYVLFLNSSGSIELTSAPSGQGVISLYSPSGLIELNRWYHLASVIDSQNGVMRIFLNGAEVASGAFGKNIHVSALPLRIGWTHEEKVISHGAFAGQIDEVRIWNITRTQKEIQSTMHTTLKGKEPGLVGYWQFDDDQNIAADSSPSHSDGKLIGDAHVVEAKLPAVLSGRIKDEEDKPVQYISVRLEQDDEEIAQAKTDEKGNYGMVISEEVSGLYDLSATRGEKGDWQLGVHLREGEDRMLNLTLKKAISIEGRLSMLNDTTPPRSILEATRNGKVVATTSSRESGQYRFINLKPGRYQVRCYIPDGKYVYYGESKDKPVVDAQDATYLQVERDKTIGNIDFRLEQEVKRVNRVLNLDGDGDYVEIVHSESLNAIDAQVTMEAWIKPAAFLKVWSIIIHKADEMTGNTRNRSFCLTLNSSGFVELASAPEGQGQLKLNSPRNMIELNKWYHVAGVINAKNGGMRMFINGVEVARQPFGKDIHISKLPLLIGYTHEKWLVNFLPFFAGQIDEVRIWNIARMPEEIRATMHTTLSGKEPGLVGYWQFDVGKNITIDSSPSHSDGKLIGDAHCVEAELPEPGELLIPTVISGRITTEDDKPIEGERTNVRLEQDGEEIAQTWADAEENYRLVIPEKVRGSYDLFARKNYLGLGDLRLGLRLHEGEHIKLNLTLTKAVSIEGKLMMLDDTTPQVAVHLQALRNGKVIDGTLSDENGKYKFINLKPGPYQVRCYVVYDVSKPVLIPGEYVYYTESEDNPVVDASRATTLHVERGRTRQNIDFRLAPFKKGTWRHFDTSDGLASMAVNTIYQDSEGVLWFGTGTWNTIGSGISRYDGKTFTTFTTKDGLAHNDVFAIHRDPSGVLWFGTGRGVSRYDGKGFVNFTTEVGLRRGGYGVEAIHRTPDGVMWFATASGGVYSYDERTFTNLTADDGLMGDSVQASLRDPDGILWIGTSSGIFCYDGKKFVNFTAENGLTPGPVSVIHCDPDGTLWFGTGGFYPYPGGVIRYAPSAEDTNGKRCVNLNTEDGLAGDRIMDIHRDSNGILWFGTQGGVSRYDGEKGGFANLTPKDGLAGNWVCSVCSDPDGVLWFGTSGGVSRYAKSNGRLRLTDGREFVNFTTKDGLVDDGVQAIHKDVNDVLWFGTSGGVSRYDGEKFVNFTQKDGLAGNWVRTIHSDSDGILWFGTFGAVFLDTMGLHGHHWIRSTD